MFAVQEETESPFLTGWLAGVQSLAAGATQRVY